MVQQVRNTFSNHQRIANPARGCGGSRSRSRLQRILGQFSKLGRQFRDRAGLQGGLHSEGRPAPTPESVQSTTTTWRIYNVARGKLPINDITHFFHVRHFVTCVWHLSSSIQYPFSQEKYEFLPFLIKYELLILVSLFDNCGIFLLFWKTAVAIHFPESVERKSIFIY